MGDTPQTQALIILAQKYAGDVVSQVNRKATTLSLLPKKIGKGKNVAWAAESDGSETAEAFAETADASNFDSDAQAEAKLDWARYRKNFKVSDQAMDVARVTGDPMGNVALLARNMVNTSAELASHLNAEILNGDSSTNEIVSLADAIGSTSNQYATIDRSSAAYWRPYVAAPGSLTTLTKDLVRSDLSSIYTQSGVRPDLAICHPDVFRKVVGLFDSDRRFTQNAAQSLRPQLGELSIPGVSIDGCMFVEDKDGYAESDNGSIYYLNTDHVWLEILPSSMDEVSLFPERTQIANDGFSTMPFGFRVTPLARTGPTKKVQMSIYCQLVVDKPHACGMRKDVDIS